MKKNLSNETPHEDWTLEHLGKFAQQVAKRTAHDAWLLGRAYTIAKAQAKAEGQKIEEWRKQWLPFLSQPTLSRYEAVGKLPEDDVREKSITEVYKLLGFAPQKFSPTENKDAPSDPASASEPPQPPAYNIVPAEPEVEPDSLLKRLASVVTLLHSIIRDMPSLDRSEDATGALDDAAILLQKVRAVLEQKAAA